MDEAGFVEGARALGLVLTRAQVDAFVAFESRLYEANRVMNLTRVPPEECWSRHFLDSLLFHDLIPQGSRVLDIGTGPGLPAWPLACARPDFSVVALDSSGKMIGFLRTQPLPNLKPQLGRAEADLERERFDVVTGRAVAPLAIQLELSAAACRMGGLLLPLRTAHDAPEIARLAAENPLGLRLEETVIRRVSGLDAERWCPVFRKVKHTPRLYPRSWAEIRRAPV